MILQLAAFINQLETFFAVIQSVEQLYCYLKSHIAGLYRNIIFLAGEGYVNIAESVEPMTITYFLTLYILKISTLLLMIAMSWD